MTELNLTETEMDFIREALSHFNKAMNKGINEAKGELERDLFHFNYEQGKRILSKITKVTTSGLASNKD